jgi:hypothetical protein
LNVTIWVRKIQMSGVTDEPEVTIAIEKPWPADGAFTDKQSEGTSDLGIPLTDFLPRGHDEREVT